MTPTEADSPAVTVDSPAPPAKPDGKRWLVPGAVVLVIVVILGAAAIGGVGPFSRTSTAWSAVFLSDNEVYFGHIKSATDDDIDLVNVAYLQKSQTTAANAATATQAQTPAQLSILGLVANQIQCPKDEVVINRHNVINVQELQSTSFVVSRLETLAKTSQNCFLPPAATPTAAGAAPAAAPAPAATATSAVRTSPSTTPTARP